MKKSLQILNSNYEIKEGTFLYQLHEYSTFHEPLFWDYYNSVITITKETLDKPIDRKINTAIVSTHSKILESFLWHLSQDDSYVIKNYPNEKMIHFLERLDFMIDGYLAGYLMSENSFGDELRNPKMADKNLNNRKEQPKND